MKARNTMSDTGNAPETNQPNEEKLAAQPNPAPTQANDAPAAQVDPAEVERLKKELEQAQLRKNQLENEAKARAEKEAAEEAKRLEEQGEWQKVAEQERIKREELEREQEQLKKSQAISAAKADVLKGFDQEVVESAQDLGIDLSDDSEEAVAAFKEKLDKLNARVGSSGGASVRPNNPGQPAVNGERSELIQAHLKANGSSNKYMNEALGGLNAINVMKQQAGWEEQ